MKYFFEERETFKQKTKGKKLFLFLDYDGTLTPIVDLPQNAKLSIENHIFLKNLSQNPSCRVSIVSGRALNDLRQMVGIKNIDYIGNHGFEFDVPGVDFKGFDLSHTREIFEYLKWEINKEMVFFKGAFLEDKGINLCVHYRQLNENKIKVFKAILNQITVPFYLRNEVHIELDRKTFEIRPPFDWDKGKAIVWLIDELKKQGLVQDFLPVYIGDSATDEYAFKALQGKGLTVKVGRSSKSFANCYIKKQHEVIYVLKELLN